MQSEYNQMNILNVELKARCHDPERVLTLLKEREAEFRGIDHQVDTYFTVPNGRLKLREGDIENSLIFYHRDNEPGAKSSHIELLPLDETGDLKSLLTAALGIWVVVDKKREIYFIDNVKFHIDLVDNLGHFIEVEAIDKNGNFGEPTLRQQCRFYRDLFDIGEKDLVAESYSDLLHKDTQT
ncbi:MAG: class IV adenylate cyclase [Balneolaceae bacterium]|nr:class IV adenylate cyclase [Balneolaceae bacterium]